MKVLGLFVMPFHSVSLNLTLYISQGIWRKGLTLNVIFFPKELKQTLFATKPESLPQTTPELQKAGIWFWSIFKY